ncbi:SGNH/GDSL hydrolase family protein [Desulfosporosinus sp. SYSU MS00001]|uniref:SGNH/GDSL hydrolase family protein n=1 Tax=Desulfosporosinus sp. SYSU MS00001 TaxID=3416284 RepID=UPI003CEBB450
MNIKNRTAMVLSLAILITISSIIAPNKVQATENTAVNSTTAAAPALTGIKKLKTSNINVVILGDSIAVNQGASDPSTTGWESILFTSLTSMYSHNILWYNKGSSGTLVDYCLQRADEIAENTDAVFICVGRNDRNYYTPDQFCLKYIQLIQLIKNKAPNADIFCIVEPPMVSSDESLFKAIRSQISLASKSYGANLLDVWSAFPTNQTDLAAVLSDGLHPKDKGYKLMSNYIYKQLITKINEVK